MRKHKGFTLIEILVTVVIIAILTAIGVVAYSSINKRSRDAKRKSDIEQIRSALEMYRSDNGYYPNITWGDYAHASGLETLLDPYIPDIPSDPLSTQYYWYKELGLSDGKYYAYCLSAHLEAGAPASKPCTAYNGYNYAVKNPYDTAWFYPH